MMLIKILFCKKRGKNPSRTLPEFIGQKMYKTLKLTRFSPNQQGAAGSTQCRRSGGDVIVNRVGTELLPG